MTHNRNCEICRGSGVIRLPIYAMSVKTFGKEDFNRDTSRSYPCPECGDSAPIERVSLLQIHKDVDSRIDDPRFVNAVKYDAARQISADILKKGLIKFERGDIDDRLFSYPLLATVGVVSQKTVAAMEQRISEHQENLARQVMARAAAEIRVWGSYYSGDEGGISKSQAVDSVNGALEQVLKERAQFKRIA